MPYGLTDADPSADAVRRMTFVPFLPDGTCLAIPSGSRIVLPTGSVELGEHYLLDTALRVPLMTAGFRHQRVHPFAVNDVAGGLHVYAWSEGGRYRGRRPHAAVELVQGSAESIAVRFHAQGDELSSRLVMDAAHSYRRQDDESYFADNLRLLEPAYLRGTTPQEGSGTTATAGEWRARREMIVDGIDRDGTFLDVGCANGLLMESVQAWAAERGMMIDPYGVDIGARLVDEARRRLPHWADRIEVGNALYYQPPRGRRFTFVHALLDLVPRKRRGDLVRHLLDNLVEPGGRLLMSQYGPGDGEPTARQLLETLAYEVEGVSGNTAWIRADA